MERDGRLAAVVGTFVLVAMVGQHEFLAVVAHLLELFDADVAIALLLHRILLLVISSLADRTGIAALASG